MNRLERLQGILSKIDDLQTNLHDRLNSDNVDQYSNLIDELGNVVSKLEDVYNEERKD